MKIILVALCAMAFAATASATIVFNPSISYQSATVVQDDPLPAIDAESGRLLADIKLGYVLPMGLYLGAMYQLQSDTNLNDTSSYNVGPTVGYFNPQGFYALLTYHLLGESEDVVVSGDKYTDATGPQLDLGWVFPLTSSFSLGPQLTYRQISYGNYDNGTTSVATDRVESDIRPYVSLWFMF